MNWTSQAQQHLNTVFRRQAKTWEEADSEEVESDLRAHIEEELKNDGVEVVTVEALDRVLGRLGLLAESDTPEEQQQQRVPASATPQEEETSETKFPRLSGIPFLIFAILIPLGTLLYEFFSGACASMFFDPIPTVWHILLVAIPPLALAYVHFTSKSAGTHSYRWMALATGLAIGIGVYYAALYAPLSPFAVVGILFAGFGLVPLAPILCFLGALIARWRIGKRGAEVGELSAIRRNTWIGIAVGLAALALVEFSGYSTRIGMNRAALAQTPEETASAVSWLRMFGSEKTLLQASYEGRGRGMQHQTDTTGWVSKGLLTARSSAEGARELYYRVTGRAFNTVPPPNHGRRGFGASRQNLDNFVFDPDVGGTNVAARIRGLSLDSSRLDTHIDRDSALAYSEWTMVFENENRNAQEARFQVSLPPGGCVSRLTLWVNGEPQEAAFGGKGEVREAYQKIAVVQRRDPVLVTSCGPDRVLVQCFPVPPNQGKMKIRLGITAPVDRQNRVWLPSIAERNFNIIDGLKHSLWAQGNLPLSLPATDTSADEEGGFRKIHLELPHMTFQSAYLACESELPHPVVHTIDPHAPEGEKLLIRRWEELQSPAPQRILLVVDTSVALAEHKEAIADAVDSLGKKVTLYLADDLPSVDLSGDPSVTLRRTKFVGGKPNLPALNLALRDAQDGAPASILWIHGPQPLDPEGVDAFEQLLDRGFRNPHLTSIQLEPGANRIFELLHRHATLKLAPPIVDSAEELTTVLAQLTDGGVRQNAVWERGDEREIESAKNAAGEEVWDHLARHWANTQVIEEFYKQNGGEKQRLANVKLASRYQLVTPFTGAVVLETKQQFEDADLDQVDPSAVPTIPSVPEPSSALTILLFLCYLGLRRRR